MASAVKSLKEKGLLGQHPRYLDMIQYEVIMGSVAYGVSSDTSDMDVYGFCIPPKDYIFPHLRGEIQGFSKPGARFDQFQKHHIKDPSACSGHGREYDLTIYSIIRFFKLCMDNNPNMIDSLFVPRRCVLFTTQIGEMVREKRKMFLHKGAWHKFKGYAFSQMHKLKTKSDEHVKAIRGFEQEYGIPHDITFAELHEELRLRGLEE